MRKVKGKEKKIFGAPEKIYGTVKLAEIGKLYKDIIKDMRLFHGGLAKMYE